MTDDSRSVPRVTDDSRSVPRVGRGAAAYVSIVPPPADAMLLEMPDVVVMPDPIRCPSCALDERCVRSHLSSDTLASFATKVGALHSIQIQVMRLSADDMQALSVADDAVLATRPRDAEAIVAAIGQRDAWELPWPLHQLFVTDLFFEGIRLDGGSQHNSAHLAMSKWYESQCLLTMRAVNRDVALPSILIEYRIRIVGQAKLRRDTRPLPLLVRTLAVGTRP